MNTDTRELNDLFTLNVVAPHLKDFQPPEGPHDPQGDWVLAYGVYTLGSIQGHGGRAGSLSVRRQVADERGSILNIDYEKRVNPDFSQKVAARITCRGDALATPLRWTFSSEIASRTGGPVENTRLEKSAVARDGHIETGDGKHVRRLPVSTPFAINWALFEAVGRLPREPFEPIRFTLIDHFDQLKAGQVLSYRQSVDVRLGAQPSSQRGLHAFDHVGQGVVPWIYWVDEQGRLWFAVSGLEAYLLESVSEGKAS